MLPSVIDDYRVYTLRMSPIRTTARIQYSLKIMTNGFHTFSGGNGNRTFSVFGGNG